MTLPAPVAAGLDRFTLPNGLRVLLQHQPGIPRAAVSVHYGVGFRSEPPGREGFAHLFEHLMFRGSASLPGGRFYDHVHRLGSRANGTTHQDYTDYYQVAPAEALEQALFAEADRMRAPCSRSTTWPNSWRAWRTRSTARPRTGPTAVSLAPAARSPLQPARQRP